MICFAAFGSDLGPKAVEVLLLRVGRVAVPDAQGGDVGRVAPAQVGLDGGHDALQFVLLLLVELAAHPRQRRQHRVHVPVGR